MTLYGVLLLVVFNYISVVIITVFFISTRRLLQSLGSAGRVIQLAVMVSSWFATVGLTLKFAPTRITGTAFVVTVNGLGAAGLMAIVWGLWAYSNRTLLRPGRHDWIIDPDSRFTANILDSSWSNQVKGRHWAGLLLLSGIIWFLVDPSDYDYPGNLDAWASFCLVWITLWCVTSVMKKRRH